MASERGFACVCVPKAVEFGQDHKLHRATKDQELHDELEHMTEAGPSNYVYQQGGGCRAVGADVHTAAVGDAVAVFQGHLANLLDLAKACVTGEAEAEALNPAEVICHLYNKLGVDLLLKLKGHFAFCMYEGKLMRVLAARDGSGEVPLYQARSSKDSLVISSNKSFLDSAHDVLEFNPGDYKYGWHADPRQFSPSDLNPHKGRKSLDHGHGHGFGNGHHTPSSRRSIDQGGPPRSMDMSPLPASALTSALVQHQQQQDAPASSNGPAPSPAGPATPAPQPQRSAQVGIEALEGAVAFKWDINAPNFVPKPAGGASTSCAAEDGSTAGQSEAGDSQPQEGKQQRVRGPRQQGQGQGQQPGGRGQPGRGNQQGRQQGGRGRGGRWQQPQMGMTMQQGMGMYPQGMQYYPHMYGQQQSYYYAGYYPGMYGADMQQQGGMGYQGGNGAAMGTGQPRTQSAGQRGANGGRGMQQQGGYNKQGGAQKQGKQQQQQQNREQQRQKQQGSQDEGKAEGEQAEDGDQQGKKTRRGHRKGGKNKVWVPKGGAGASEDGAAEDGKAGAEAGPAEPAAAAVSADAAPAETAAAAPAAPAPAETAAAPAAAAPAAPAASEPAAAAAPESTGTA